MRSIILLFVLFCTSCFVAKEKEKPPLDLGSIADLFTQELANSFYDSGKKSVGEPERRIEGDDLYLDFPVMTIRIGAGGSFFTEVDAKTARNGLSSAVFPGAFSPDIGKRAHVFGIEDDILQFTTSDGEYDVEIRPKAQTPELDVKGLGKEISDRYDRIVQSQQ